MSRRDPGAANGAVAVEPGWCECGEIESVHAINKAGSRGACSRSDCNCRQFTPSPTGRVLGYVHNACTEETS